MNLRGIVLPAIMLAAWPLAARDDRPTCEIKSLSADVLYSKLVMLWTPSQLIAARVIQLALKLAF